MPQGWDAIIRRYRLRHSVSQARLGQLLGVSQRTVSRWERGEDRPSVAIQRRLRDLGWMPPEALMQSLAASVVHAPIPRALSATERLRLLALSPGAIAKRPSIVAWIGRDLRPLATGVLLEMLDDRALQQAIAAREIANVIATTAAVLRTPDASGIGRWQTTITYFYRDGTFFSDAMSTPAAADAPLGWRAIAMDEIVVDGL